MTTRSNRGKGKLYETYGGEFVANISYLLNEKLAMEPSLKRWSGELILVEHVQIRDGATYVIELEDKRKSRCSLRRRTNRAVVGVPPRYVYLFLGSGSLE